MPIDRRVTLDVRLYHFTPGDSSVQLLKSQTLEVEQNQRNDLVMVYRDAFYIQHPELANDSLVRLPMYEFYFDSPIGIEGDFYVEIHSEDSLLLYHGWRNKMNEVSCCQHGYEGIIHMARNVLLDGWSMCYHSGLIDEISWIPHHPILAPQTDTIFTFVSQAIFPIIRPQGYLTAMAPTMEGENVRLLPNPARTRVSVEASAPIRSVDVADLMGRNLMEKQYTGDAQTVVLDVAALSQGSYVVRVRTDKEETTLKLLIER